MFILTRNSLYIYIIMIIPESLTIYSQKCLQNLQCNCGIRYAMVVEISAQQCQFPSQAQGTTVEMPSARATFIHSKITSEFEVWKWWNLTWALITANDGSWFGKYNQEGKFVVFLQKFQGSHPIESNRTQETPLLWRFCARTRNAWNDYHETLDGQFEQQTQENI